MCCKWVKQSTITPPKEYSLIVEHVNDKDYKGGDMPQMIPRGTELFANALTANRLHAKKKPPEAQCDLQGFRTDLLPKPDRIVTRRTLVKDINRWRLEVKVCSRPRSLIWI